MLRSPWSYAPLPLLLASTAWGHVPHDPCYWVAISPGEKPEWVTTTLPVHVRDSLLLVRTSDQQNVELRFMIADDEGIKGAAMLSATRLALATNGEGLWISEDVGDSHSAHPDVPPDAVLNQVVASPDILADGVAFVAGSTTTKAAVFGGIWRSSDSGDSWELVADLPDLVPWDLKLAPDWSSSGRAAMVTREGVVFTSEDFGLTWTEQGALQDGVYEISPGAGDRIWLATDGGGLFRSDDGGQSFEPTGYDAKPVTTVAEFPGELVMFTYNDEAVYVSRDGGETWEHNNDAIEDAAPGQPADGVHYYELAMDGAGHYWLAAWEGLVKSEDEGATWQHIETYLPEANRDIAVTLLENDAVGLVTSGFGGGSELVDEALGVAAPLALDLVEPFFKRVAASHYWDQEGMAMIYLLTWLCVTTDGDKVWERYAEEEMGDFWDLAVAPSFQDQPTILAAGNIDVGGGWCLSPDEGSSWDCYAPEVESNFCSAAHISDSFGEDGYAWVACGDVGEVQYSDNFGQDWNKLGEAQTQVWGLAGTPDGEKLFLATQHGLFLSESGGSIEPAHFEGQPVWDVAVSPQWDDEQAVFAIVAGDGWYRSLDGGEKWEVLDAPTADPVMTVALSPLFAEDGTLAVGGFDGNWLSRDQGETWVYSHALELITDFHPLWSFSEGWVQEMELGAINETRRVAFDAGEVATLRFRGVGVDLISATGSEPGTMSVTLDGEHQADVDLQGDMAHRAPVLQLRDLEDTWHSLEVTVQSGVGVVDSAIVWRQDFQQMTLPGDTAEEEEEPDSAAPSDSDEAKPGRRCGNCASSRGGGWLLVVPGLLLAFRRRRRLGRCS